MAIWSKSSTWVEECMQERVGLQNGNIVKSKVAYMYVACCMMTFQNLQISVANSKVRVRIGETNFWNPNNFHRDDMTSWLVD